MAKKEKPKPKYSGGLKISYEELAKKPAEKEKKGRKRLID